MERKESIKELKEIRKGLTSGEVVLSIIGLISASVTAATAESMIKSFSNSDCSKEVYEGAGFGFVYVTFLGASIFKIISIAMVKRDIDILNTSFKDDPDFTVPCTANRLISYARQYAKDKRNKDRRNMGRNL